MTFEEYQLAGRDRYLSFVGVIQNILQQALDQHSLVAHAITGRAKEFASLRKKLINRNMPLDQEMNEIKDLAGCRIVFLTNSQVERFNNTGALQENFEVLSVNVHHPIPGTDTETKLFDSTNYLVRLKPDRLTLPEYRQFEGLHAEIQIQTLLNHAWAEMGHDTIYKEPKLTHLGAACMTAIGERMNIAEQKPDLALLMMDEVSEQAASFLAAMLAGLDRVGRLGEVLARVDEWIAAGRFLFAMGDYLHHKPDTDVQRLKAFVTKAIERGEQASVVSAARIAAVWYQRAAAPALIEEVLLPAIRYVRDHRLPQWIDQFVPPGDAAIVRALSEPQATELLQSFVEIPEVDHQAVRLMVVVGRQYPQLVIDFFGTRLRRKRDESERRFDAVPFHPHDLAKVLSPHADLLLRAMRQW